MGEYLLTIYLTSFFIYLLFPQWWKITNLFLFEKSGLHNCFTLKQMIKSRSQIQYDHIFVSYQHKSNTNNYSFTFPEHWRSYNSSSKSVLVRSIKVNAAARDAIVRGIKLRGGSLILNISFQISLASDEDTSVLNTKLNQEKRNIFEEYKADSTSNPLCLQRHYIKIRIQVISWAKMLQSWARYLSRSIIESWSEEV